MRYLVGLLLLLTGIAQAASSETSVAPAAKKRLVILVTLATKSYNELLSTELGLERTKAVRVEISTDDDDFLNRLVHYNAVDAVRSAKNFRGIMLPGRRLLLRLDADASAKTIGTLMAQTLTYSLQQDLAGGSAERARPWIREGMKFYISAMLLQKMGAQSFETWKLDVTNTLRLANDYPTPQSVANMSSGDWSDLNAQPRYAHELMANLMMGYLYEKNGDKLIGQMSAYYHCLVRGFTREKTCFAEGFGTEPEQFSTQVQSWVTETLAKKGGLEIVANGQDEIAAEVSKAYAVAQALIEEKLGQKLGITVRVHLNQTQQEMAGQLQAVLGKTKIEAAGQAQAFAWVAEENTVLINTGRVNTPEKRADVIAQLVMRRYLNSHGVNLAQAYWFGPGLQEWMSEQLLDKLAVRPAVQSLALRKKVLEEAKEGIPTLSALTTHAAWNDASRMYGDAVLKQLVAEATDALLAKNGVAALAQWIQISDKRNGSGDAFSQAFGETADTFSKNFKLPYGLNFAAEKAPSLVSKAVPAKCERPVYPKESMQRGEAGTVTLEVLIDAGGSVTDKKIDISSGYRLLDQAALDAFSSCVFKPAMSNGVAIASWKKIAYVWALR